MQSVDSSTGKPLLSFKDAFKIRNIENYKLAEMYLANMIETNERRSQTEKDKREQANIQAQQQSATMANEQALQIQQEKLQQEKDIKEFESTKQKELALLNGLMQSISKGVIDPNTIMPAIQQLVPNITIPLTVENQQMKQNIVQAAALNMQQQSNQEEQQEPVQEQPQQEAQEPVMQ